MLSSFSTASSSLPPAVLYSAAELRYLHEGIIADCRQDGRSRLDYRYFHIKTGIRPQANGSAEIRLEDTIVDVTINLQVTSCSPLLPDEGIITCSVEWYHIILYSHLFRQ